MRILHIIYDDVDNPWLGGGGATRTLEIYSRIARQGHDVTVLCGNYPGAPRRHMRQGVTYRHVGSRRSYAVSRITFALMSPFLIMQGGYDIVIEDVSPFSPVGVPLWNRRVPCVASVQNLSGRHALRKYGLAGLIPRLVERPLLSLFRNFVAVSPGIARELRPLRGRHVNVKVIPNSAALGFSRDEGETEQASDKRYILFLGRIDIYQKGLDILLEAFSRSAAQLPDVRLVIAGSGTEQQLTKLGLLVAKNRYKDRIELAGQVDQEKAARLMRSALMLVMPSRYEAWPLTAIEAGAAGIPVVGFDILGVRDAAPPFPAGHGQLVANGDVGALAEQITKVATEPKMRHEMGENGRLWAARFTWDALAAEQLAFYEELVQAECARGNNRNN
ncbi:MAG: glycosyltransferase family 4 protein [Chloroflexia bacterium]